MTFDKEIIFTSRNKGNNNAAIYALPAASIHYRLASPLKIFASFSNQSLKLSYFRKLSATLTVFLAVVSPNITSFAHLLTAAKLTLIHVFFNTLLLLIDRCLAISCGLG